MEQPNTLMDKDNLECLCGLKDGSVVLASSRGGNVLHTRPGSTEDIVDEWEL